MTRRLRRPDDAGYTLVEIAVTVAVIALLAMLAAPSFGTAVRASRERFVIEKLKQDFLWARGAAGAADAGSLMPTLSGSPVVTLTFNADCSWTTRVNGAANPDHSTVAATLATQVPGLACTATASLPATLTFSSAGYVDSTLTLTYTGASAQAYPLQVLNSGTLLRLSPVAGAQS